jgi:hypothetical protein
MNIFFGLLASDLTTGVEATIVVSVVEAVDAETVDGGVMEDVSRRSRTLSGVSSARTVAAAPARRNRVRKAIRFIFFSSIYARSMKADSGFDKRASVPFFAVRRWGVRLVRR